jgi:hypothetical protein
MIFHVTRLACLRDPRVRGKCGSLRVDTRARVEERTARRCCEAQARRAFLLSLHFSFPARNKKVRCCLSGRPESTFAASSNLHIHTHTPAPGIGGALAINVGRSGFSPHPTAPEKVFGATARQQTPTHRSTSARYRPLASLHSDWHTRAHAHGRIAHLSLPPHTGHHKTKGERRRVLASYLNKKKWPTPRPPAPCPGPPRPAGAGVALHLPLPWKPPPCPRNPAQSWTTAFARPDSRPGSLRPTSAKSLATSGTSPRSSSPSTR